MPRISIGLEELLSTRRRQEVASMEARLSDGEPREVLLQTAQGSPVCVLRLRLHASMQSGAMYSSAVMVATPLERRQRIIAWAHSEIDTSASSLRGALDALASLCRSHASLLRRVSRAVRKFTIYDKEDMRNISANIITGTQLYDLFDHEGRLCRVVVSSQNRSKRFHTAIALPASREGSFQEGNDLLGTIKTELGASGFGLHIALFRLAGIAERQSRRL